jgi:hypothetical protein
MRNAHTIYTGNADRKRRFKMPRNEWDDFKFYLKSTSWVRVSTGVIWLRIEARFEFLN